MITIKHVRFYPASAPVPALVIRSSTRIVRTTKRPIMGIIKRKPS